MTDLVVNNMKMTEHNSYYLGKINKYLVLVFTVDLKNGHKCTYADFLDNTPEKNDLEQIMKYGFTPYDLSKWLSSNLEGE